MLSFPEILVILLVAVIVLGPKRLPEAARKLGHWVGVFRRAGEAFKQELMNMDRAVDATLNHAVNEIDLLEPEPFAAAMEDVEAEVGGALEEAFAPPSRTPDAVLETPPLPGGLAPETLPDESREKTGPETSAPLAPAVGNAEVIRREGMANGTSSVTAVHGTAPAAGMTSGKNPAGNAPEDGRNAAPVSPMSPGMFGRKAQSISAGFKLPAEQEDATTGAAAEMSPSLTDVMAGAAATGRARNVREGGAGVASGCAETALSSGADSEGEAHP